MAKELRRKARELCIQVLYSYYLSGNPLDQVIETVLAFNDYPDHDSDHLRELATRTTANTEALDARIREHAVNWEFHRISMIDKIILRQAVAEFIYLDDVPPKVTMSEAVELAKDFSTNESFAFINGVLDPIYHDLINEGRIIPPSFSPAPDTAD